MNGNNTFNRGLAWLVGVLWLFGVVILVFMGLTSAAAVMLAMLIVFAALVVLPFGAPSATIGRSQCNLSRRKAARKAGRYARP